MTQPTPTPWAWDFGNTDALYSAADLARMKQDRLEHAYEFWPKAIVETDGRQYGPNDADAALIVCAVNSHATLVEALEVVVDELSAWYDGSDNVHADTSQALEKAATALAQAKAIQMARTKCLVHDCPNHTDEGGFVGTLCVPCHRMITTQPIRRAVNAHAALVEALRELSGAVEAEENGNEGSLQAAQQKARAALKLARGE